MTGRIASRPPQLGSKKSGMSGQHPAVKAYRAKLDSIDKGACAATNKLDKMLEEYLSELKTPLPEKPIKTRAGETGTLHPTRFLRRTLRPRPRSLRQRP